MIRDVFYYGTKPNVHPRERFAENLADARQQCSTEHFWIINEFSDYKRFDWDFDFEMLPDEDVWSQEHNNVWPSQHQKDSGTWLCSNEYSDIIIYRGDVDPIYRKNERTSNWVILENIDESKVDFSWHPDPSSPPYVYKWGCKFFPAELKHVLEYRVPNATHAKYMNTIVELLPNYDCWVEHDLIDKTKFDMSWRPDPLDPPFVYIWGNKWVEGKLKPTLVYHAPNAIDKKYMPDFIPVLPLWDKWVEVQAVDKNKFDFTWRPDPNDPPYIYVFGNQWHTAEIMPTLTYTVEGATEKKYVNDVVAKLKPNIKNFKILHPIVEDEFDFSWRPDPTDPPYIYVFGNNKYSAAEMPTVEYHVAGATEVKYIDDITAQLAPNMKNWNVPKNIDTSSFDFSWVPHPASPPYVYQFGTLLGDIWVEDGPKYVTPDHDGVVVRLENSLILTDEISYPRYYLDTSLENLVKEHPAEMFWVLNNNINYESFDFSWKPMKENLFSVTVFGSPESEITQTYFVNAPTYLEGHTGLNFIQQDQEIDEKYLAELFVKPDMFYVDRGNSEAKERFDALKVLFGNRIQKTRYLNSWVDTINRCINRSTTDLLWILNSELDYTSFDFNYYPNPWQMKMVNIFGTQWSHWGTTFLVNKEYFAEETKYISIIEHLSCLNFVKNIRATATQCVHDIVLIDHGNIETAAVLDTIKTKSSGCNITVIDYKESYIETLKQIVNILPTKKEHYIWICASVCDYTTFDFTYICDPYAKDQLHVFPSGIQKFGDTFFVDINRIRQLIEKMTKLDDLIKVNYNSTIKTMRLPEPIIVNDKDTHVDVVNQINGFPYATIITSDNLGIEENNIEPMSLWASESKNIVITSTGATRIIVPKEAAAYVNKELYDYPYIKRSPKLTTSKPLDIVFLSNGETGANENYEHLLEITKDLPNRIVRVDGVNGRVAAYHAAAEASETPWMFTVFAKLKVNNKFDWAWQPDRMQVPKHYIFHAKNPVNGLIYGHQAMIAYNKKLTLANKGAGLDFTLDDEHEVVPLVSGTANYNTDSFSTWRTSFREVLKLKADDSEESRVRLDTWMNQAEGEYAEFSIKGAVDAARYYDKVDGDFDALKLSYEWAWLSNYFNKI